MKFLDKVGLIVFANLVLILSVIICVVIFGWLDMGTVDYVLRAAFTDTTSSNIILAVCALLILLAIKCIFFTSEDKEVNGVKDGILLQNADGQLVISKNTLEELVSNVVKGFDSAQNVSTRIELDKEKNLVVNVILNVKETAIIKELSTNLQTKIKTAIKKASDLEVKEVNISVKELKPQMTGEEIISEKEV
ncbi:MAG: alkaline shock response membrane anchor protein AmaP [Clostridia bacterium]